MLAGELQSLLDVLYGTNSSLDVNDFLVTDAAVIKYLSPQQDSTKLYETLFVQQDDDELGLTLYLDEDLLERLRLSDPMQSLHEHNLSDFCTVLEGISHFNYMVWNAAKDKCVTVMELEMQAEVDKYFGARVLLEHQDNTALAASLLSQLFDAPAFHETLSREELVRYQDASEFAGRYCRSLESRFSSSRMLPGLVEELRAFYRWPQPAKVSHIQSAQFS